MYSNYLDFFFRGLMVFSTSVFILLTLRQLFLRKYIRELQHVVLPDNKIIWPKVSLVIPVCNESDTVEAAAETLLKMDYPNIEFIFVNDRSSDNTPKILEKLKKSDSRIQVIHISTLPRGWIGKLHAFHQGISKATGKWVLFSDADVHYHRQALKKAIFHSLQNKLDFLGVIPSVVSPSFWSRLLLGQIMHYYSLYTSYNKLLDSKSSAAAAHGAFMLVNKKAYLQSRGFEWLKMEVMDDVGFATEMKTSGFRIDTLHGVNEIEFDWYTNVKQVILGFEKNMFAALQFSYFNVIAVNILFLLIFLSYTIGPFIVQDLQYTAVLLCSIILYSISTSIHLKKIIQLPHNAALLFSITWLFFPFLILRSAFVCLKNNGIYWRGTFYSIQELRAGQRLKLLKNSRNSD